MHSCGDGCFECRFFRKNNNNNKKSFGQHALFFLPQGKFWKSEFSIEKCL